jgi:FtsH-binding integral membrane protein
MVIVLTLISSFDKNKIFLSWGGYLFIGLSTLIVFELLDIIFFYQTTGTRTKLYSMISIALFMGFVLYDTQLLQTRAVEVIKQCGQKVSCANYPVESLNLFLDTLNLFLNVSQLNKD